MMKDRKQLQHSELVNEVIRQLSTKFQPSLPMIKKSIERLIGKDYLERDEQDRRALRYLVSFNRSLRHVLELTWSRFGRHEFAFCARLASSWPSCYYQVTSVYFTEGARARLDSFSCNCMLCFFSLLRERSSEWYREQPKAA